MDHNLSYLIQGLLLGLAAGFLPGPIMVIVITKALQQGQMAGLKVSLGSLGMDVIRIVFVFLLLNFLPRNPAIVGAIAIAGALFLSYMAYNSFTYKVDLDIKPSGSNQVLLGLMANLLNPSTYIFWIAVGGPIILGARNSGAASGGLVFVVGFLCSIFAINIFIGALSGKIKQYMNSVYYKYALRILGTVLIVFAFLFLKQAYHSFIK